jgi:hypothetical protein
MTQRENITPVLMPPQPRYPYKAADSCSLTSREVQKSISQTSPIVMPMAKSHRVTLQRPPPSVVQTV